MLWLFCTLLKLCQARLVIPESQLTSLTQQQVEKEGELVGEAVEAGQCGVEELVKTFQFWVETSAGEERQTAKESNNNINDLVAAALNQWFNWSPRQSRCWFISRQIATRVRNSSVVLLPSQGSLLVPTEIVYMQELNCLDQTDPALANTIKENFLSAPARAEYTSRIPDLTAASFSRYGQDEWLDTVLFREMRGGVFVEIAVDSFWFESNTFLLEQRRGWTGLLVERNHYPANR